MSVREQICVGVVNRLVKNVKQLEISAVIARSTMRGSVLHLRKHCDLVMS